MTASMSVSSPEHVVPLSICYLLLLLQLRGAQCREDYTTMNGLAWRHSRDPVLNGLAWVPKQAVVDVKQETAAAGLRGSRPSSAKDAAEDAALLLPPSMNMWASVVKMDGSIAYTCMP